MARILLKHLKERGTSEPAILQSIALDMFACKSYSSHEQIAFRGQVVGFFTEIEYWLRGAARIQGDLLDEMNSLSLLRDANRGLNSKDEEFT